MQGDQEMKIVVLAGGTSTEREISISSGTGICAALRKKGHQAILVDIFCGVEAMDLQNPFPEEYDVEAASAYMKSFNDKIEEMKQDRKTFFGPNVLNLCELADIVFLGLHGANGEDGKVQATFDLMGIKYTGTGYLSSALAMDKGITKQMFRMNHVPTPSGTTMKKKDCVTDITKLGMEFPVVVKTCCGGSSVGVYMVNNQEEYEEALKSAYEYEDEVVVEEYIKGREFSVAVVDGKAYPIIEIAPIQGFYDYKNKYQAGSTIETCPAAISAELTEEMQHYAEAGAKALGLEAYCRLDFLMKENGDMYCLEANTLPGMTPTSLIPQEAQVLGIDYPSLCEELIRVSLKKYE
jgi:D-alanine-D-alanine ligase